MIPGWKLRRELARVGTQIANIPHSLAALPKRLTEPRRARAYDAAFPAALHQTVGTLQPNARLSVLVLYQPGGVAGSTLATCRWLAAAGVAPLVVSNAPLADADRAALADTAWRVVERPNFGYDFGAYRDGIRLIRAEGLQPERLLLMNDSVWCPMDADPLSALLTHAGDLVGIVQDEKVAHDRSGGRPTDRRHLESYCLSVSARLWRAPAFQAFWDGYRLTDYKPDTIRRGEIGLSRAMEAAGFDLAALGTREMFLKAMAMQETVSLCEILDHAAYDDHQFAKENAVLLTRAGWPRAQGAREPRTVQATFDRQVPGEHEAALQRRRPERTEPQMRTSEATTSLWAESAKTGPHPTWMGSGDEAAWRADALDHIRRWVNRRRYPVAFPLGNARALGTFCLKKNSEPIFAAARHSYLRAVASGLIAPPPPPTLNEVTARTATVSSRRDHGI
ncbi:rhamnan synthesis F family protein [Rhodobaculum claviforme]|uniref:Rhamnan synthesis protein F n=1 Tax=Rhodobaculum claviforme TaxID=1549854 RepID=A0A934TK87_9RHOB|nr:rhamnan synthesis F family protein [Rhodobaculum claviforme]MBK5927310.1 hypothetical protein [Rhodobaculum claviforme]